MKPFLIGLTGGIGAGKSTAAAEMSTLGAEVVAGDELGRRVLEGSPTLLSRIRDRFGPGVFDEQGKLIRRALGQRVFSNPDDARWLTQLTFPGIYKLWRDAVTRSSHRVIVLDAALIFEWGIESDFNLLITVRADRSQIVRRVSADQQWSRSEIEQRLSAQISPDAKAEKAHVVLENDGSVEEFRERIRECWITRIEPELQDRR